MQNLPLLAEAGWTAGEIALHYNCSPATVQRYARAAGVSLSKDRSRGALRLKQLLQKALPGYRLREEYHIGERLRLDFYFPDLNLAVEYDGCQHQRYIPYFHSTYEEFLEACQRDQRKEELCDQQGILLLRVTPDNFPQPEELQALALEQVSLQDQEPETPEKKKRTRHSILSSPAFKEAQRARRRAFYQRQKERQTQYGRAKSSPSAD